MSRHAGKNSRGPSRNGRQRRGRQSKPTGKSAYRGRVRGSVVVLDRGALLPDGTEVFVTPVKFEPGSPQALLAALRATPGANPEDVDELVRLIDEGKRPVRFDGPFDEGQNR